MVIDIFKELEMVVDDKSFARFATAIQSLTNWHESLEAWKLHAEASSQSVEGLNVWQMFAVAMLADVFECRNSTSTSSPSSACIKLGGRVKASRN